MVRIYPYGGKPYLAHVLKASRLRPWGMSFGHRIFLKDPHAVDSDKVLMHELMHQVLGDTFCSDTDVYGHELIHAVVNTLYGAGYRLAQPE